MNILILNRVLPAQNLESRHGDNLTMPISAYRHWFTAVAEDDVSEVRAVLSSACSEERQKLLHGQFDYKESEENMLHTTFSTPLSISVINGALNALAVLLQHGVSAETPDCGHSNILHVLVRRCLIIPGDEQGAIDIYRHLTGMLSDDVIVRLLRAPNEDGLRPLECAANDGMLGLMMAYLLTPGMYIIREENRALATYQWIDVTEYESFGEGNRMHYSPLSCITLLDRTRLDYPSTHHLFTDPVFVGWVHNKIRCGRLPAIFYLLTRCLLFAAFLFVDSDVGSIRDDERDSNSSDGLDSNSSAGLVNYTMCTNSEDIVLSEHVRYALCWYLITHSCVSMLIDISEHVMHSRRRLLCLLRNSDKQVKNCFTVYTFYRRLHTSISALVCARASLSLLGYNPRSLPITYIRIFARVMLWWSLWYFIQLVPGADYFVIALQNMFFIMFQFCLLYGIFLLGYTHLFMVEINMKAVGQCVEQFIDLPTSLYSTFLATINLLDFTQYHVNYPSSLHLAHAIFVLFVSILLLNFLVAIMSDSVAETSRYRDIMMPVQKLSVIQSMERQLFRLGGWYYTYYTIASASCVLYSTSNTSATRHLHNQSSLSITECTVQYNVKIAPATDDDAMPIDVFRAWFNILTTDDVEGATHMLLSARADERHRLLNGQFDFLETDLHLPVQVGNRAFRNPLSVAVIFGSFAVLAVMLEFDVKVDKLDAGENNILHLLVKRSVFRPSEERYVIDTYRQLQGILSKDTLVRLLQMQNKHHLRPLEYAANNGILGLVQAFLLTPGMYIIREENRGLATYQWIDVTEYESFGEGNRREWAPLFCLTLLDKVRLNAPTTAEFFADPVFLKWLHNKTYCGIIPAIFYVIVRFTLICIFLLIDSDIGGIEDYELLQENVTALTNTTNITSTVCTDFQSLTLTTITRQALCMYLITHTVLSLMADVLEAVRHNRPRHMCILKRLDNKNKDIFLQYDFYKRANAAMSILINLRAFLTLVNTDPRADVITYTRFITRSLLWWPIFYFFQLVSGADFFIVAVQNMMEILFQFCLIYSMFLFGYAHLFMMEININLRQGCAPQFIDILSSLYTTFLAMINMVDFTQFDVRNPFALYTIHAAYVLFVGILLLNFLVAIMSDRITETSKHKDVILPMQKLSVLLGMERQCLPFFRWYYTFMQRRIYSVYNDRLCIIRVTFNTATEQLPTSISV